MAPAGINQGEVETKPNADPLSKTLPLMFAVGVIP
jgi:hypothetical protein